MAWRRAQAARASCCGAHRLDALNLPWPSAHRGGETGRAHLGEKGWRGGFRAEGTDYTLLTSCLLISLKRLVSGESCAWGGGPGPERSAQACGTAGGAARSRGHPGPRTEPRRARGRCRPRAQAARGAP